MADDDKDGISNFMELARAFDPMVPNRQFDAITFDPARKRLTAIFRRWHQHYPDGKHLVEVSGNLQTWPSLAVLDNGANYTTNQIPSDTEVTISSFFDPVEEVTVVDGVTHSPPTRPATCGSKSASNENGSKSQPRRVGASVKRG